MTLVVIFAFAIALANFGLETVPSLSVPASSVSVVSVSGSGFLEPPLVPALPNLPTVPLTVTGNPPPPT
ncbi:hypothetical protein PV04_04275 [Phialophora macrospora]|uniref:Secreted protein n=1 Tax=Phialophora macrospora TaxID=1851006 RepID=A0A0D2E1W5_9EURO|nr:hypothetical protein PV04_04275 [Phialophora macrospora]